MENSIAHLPPNKQNELDYIVSLIRKKLPQAEMIILYGSYARNDYVDYDERREFGITTTYMSDYDILVVTYNITDKDAGKILDNIDDKYTQNPHFRTPLQFINESIEKLNNDLSEGRYFYTEVKREGIILHNSGKFTLTHRRELKYNEIKKQAETYFNETFQQACDFLLNVRFNYSLMKYRMASFMLHQACENFYYAINLVFTLKNNKQHNLSKLSSSVKKFSDDLSDIFPRNTEDEKRLFNLIKAAYVNARYKFDFDVTKDDLDKLIARVESLRDITEKICSDKIAEYGKIASE